MGLINPENYDAFVSYAHSDDHSTDNWITKLASKLQKILGTKVAGFDLRIDSQGLGETGQVPNILEGQLGRAEMLLVFLGDNYLKSEDCERELESFIKKSRVHDIEKRIFIIVLSESVKSKSWKQLEKYRKNDQYYFDFSKGARPEPFHQKIKWESELAPNPDLEKKVDDLVAAIMRTLSELHRATKKTILIGAVTDDLKSHRSDLLDQLRLHHDGCELELLDPEGQFNSWDENELADQIGSPTVFVLPFSGAKVYQPGIGDGGHLALQARSVPAERIVWWHVPGGIPLAQSPEQASREQESRKGQLEFLRSRAAENPKIAPDQLVLKIKERLLGTRRQPSAKLLWEGRSNLESSYRLAIAYTEQMWAKSPSWNGLRLESRSYEFSSSDDSWADLLSAYHGLLLLGHARNVKEMEAIRDYVRNIVEQQSLLIEQRSVAVNEEPRAYTPPPIAFLIGPDGSAQAKDESELAHFLDTVHRIAGGA
jgi:hypothetical protein